MSEVSDWKTIDIENMRIDNLTLSAPQGSYWQKVMGAVKRMFGAVDERVTALEQSGGGEQFQQVYYMELDADSASNVWNITSEDMDGTFLDVQVYVMLPSGHTATNIDCEFTFPLSKWSWKNDKISVTSGDLFTTAFGVSTTGGLTFVSRAFVEIDSDTQKTESGFIPWGAESGPVTNVSLSLGGESVVWPRGAEIQIWARKETATESTPGL